MPPLSPDSNLWICDRWSCHNSFPEESAPHTFPSIRDYNPKICSSCHEEVDPREWRVCTDHNHPVLFTGEGCGQYGPFRTDRSSHEPQTQDEPMRQCDRCGEQVPRTTLAGVKLYEPEEGGRHALRVCPDCNDEGLYYCYECEEFHADPDWRSGRSTKIPCPDHSLEDDRPVVECDNRGCDNRIDFTNPHFTNAHGRHYCRNCRDFLTRCNASYCPVQWGDDDPLVEDHYCPDCDRTDIPPGAEIAHPAQWDVREDCRCHLCSQIKGEVWPPTDTQFACGTCGYGFPTEDSLETVGDVRVCHLCMETQISQCEGCERDVIEDSSSIHRHVTRPGIWCEDCADSHGFWYCDAQCNRYVDEAMSCECGGIHSYNYRPESFSYFSASGEVASVSDQPFFGIELEMEDPTGEVPRSRGARKLSDYPWAYPVHDGSLAGHSHSQGDGTGGEYGFELVTHPFTWQWFQQEWHTLKGLLKDYAQMGFRSWDGERCAMHVHLSREPMTQAHQLRFVNFIYGSVNLCLAVGQRGYKSRGVQQYASFTTENRAQLVRKIRQNINPGARDHYTALNTQHEESMEARWFRGTLNPTSFRKNLEFIRSVYYFTDRYGHQSANEANYIDWLFTSPRKREYQVLTDYLKETYLKRGIR